MSSRDWKKDLEALKARLEKQGPLPQDFNVKVSELRSVRCEACGETGRFKRIAKNNFRCKKCGDQIETTPCGPDCAEHDHRVTA